MDVLSPASLPYLLVAAGTLLLAAWLLGLDPASRVNRAFALILFLRGTALVVGPLYDAATTPRLALALHAVQPYLAIPLVPATLHFLSVYPQRRGVVGRTWWGPWLLWGATLALLAWYAVDHAAYATGTWTGTEVVREDGPLAVFRGLRLPVLGLAAYVLARDYRRDPTGSAGYSLFLVAAGFALNTVFDGLVTLITTGDRIAETGWAPWLDGFAWQAPQLLCVPLGVMSLVEMARARRHEAADATLQEARRFMAYAVPLVVASAVAAALFRVAGREPVTEFIRGFWNLAVPATIAYALMRYALFSADLRVKAGVRRAIVLVAFGFTFFVVSEAAEALLSEGRSARFGLAAAMLLVLVSQPLQRGAQRAADALMPDTKPIAAMSWAERQGMYLDQYRLVEQDGLLTPKERGMMDRLAAALGFSEDQAARLESGRSLEAIQEEPHPPAPAEAGALRRVVLATLMAVVLGGLGSLLELMAGVGDFLASLVVAGAITLLLTPLDALASRLTEGPPKQPSRECVGLYESAVHVALADGQWSRRERIYLAGLAERLGIGARLRRRIDRAARRTLRSPTAGT